MFMDTPMQFEITMRLLFGQRAYHIASSQNHHGHRNAWLQKTIRKLLRLVNDLDTTPRHKKMLMGELGEASAHLKRAKEPSWPVVYALLRLVMRLLGYDYLRGARCHTPFYWQTPEQYDTATILEGGDVMQLHYDRKNAVALRGEVVEILRKQGVTDFVISLVLNTSEYEVKQLRSNQPLQRTRQKQARR